MVGSPDARPRGEAIHGSTLDAVHRAARAAHRLCRGAGAHARGRAHLKFDDRIGTNPIDIKGEVECKTRNSPDGDFQVAAPPFLLTEDPEHRLAHTTYFSLRTGREINIFTGEILEQLDLQAMEHDEETQVQLRMTFGVQDFEGGLHVRFNKPEGLWEDGLRGIAKVLADDSDRDGVVDTWFLSPADVAVFPLIDLLDQANLQTRTDNGAKRRKDRLTGICNLGDFILPFELTVCDPELTVCPPD